ncbi:MAG TPA: roadblock/LC7 domain-containing protein [Candidatus Deferrimicrobium sp.]|nr:roadblock/LC7 domain-containing protein [Candidatus Deferrimicrobium sp.]
MEEQLSEETKHLLTNLLQKLEARTELEACAVVSKEGMRIACAVGAELDADVYSAASAALVNLGETTLRQLRHGSLKEIIVRGEDGYTILTSAGPKHMIVGSCKNTSRMGYYLALLHRFSAKVAETLGYAIEAPTPVPKPAPMPVGAVGPTAASLLEGPTSTVRAQPAVSTAQIPKAMTPTPRPTHLQTPQFSQVQPEPVEDKISEALEALSIIEEPETIQTIEEPEPIAIEEPEPIAISEEPEPIPVSFEPEPIAIEEPKPISPKPSSGSIDKSALFEALQALGTEKEPAPTTATTSKVDTQALMDALKPQAKPQPTQPVSRPQPARQQIPFVGQPAPAKTAAKPANIPFVATAPAATTGDDEDLFKISDKEAVLEALKVLGWEEPEDGK